jgi:hypothetical protein
MMSFPVAHTTACLWDATFPCIENQKADVQSLLLTGVESPLSFQDPA